MAVPPRYQRLFSLASGGMGRVDLALREDGEFERVYAVKRLREAYREDPAVRTMFIDEARVAGLVRHANAVSVLDVGEDEEGPFLVMDYIEGLPLTGILRSHARAGELLPIQLALRIGIQMAAGLHAAHEVRDGEGTLLELVHRDVSPSNVLVGFDGVVRLTDFGIAKALGRSSQTDAGVLKGKLSYMSPEQLRFEGTERRSDLFALGIVLFQLLAGVHPFGNDPASRAKAIIAGHAPDLGEVLDPAPPVIVELLYELLAHTPDLRPPNADVVRQRLDRALADRLAVEPPLDLADYMLQRHSSILEQLRARILKAREQIAVEPEPSEPGPSEPGPSEPGPSEQVTETAVEHHAMADAVASPVTRRRVVAGVFGLAAASGFGLAILFLALRPGPAPQPDPPVALSDPSEPLPVVRALADPVAADPPPQSNDGGRADAGHPRSVAPPRARPSRRRSNRPDLMGW